ncbi:hypothetical protein SAMN05216319_0259 [Duganella sp. CF402]|uniref:hypothetical protein n=1 Tax=unclassified Duganella TaxID=2636909 RepID=UPI0008C29C3A|nr:MULTISPECIES: hypothetical protein [unclassified Duganella]RZT11260.1 hypothetical protein EV582_3367 [Duganella sp. BK701]SEK73807.1 hypothetical protein SAMN05216319_0259 [Duganella sp. CF402]
MKKLLATSLIALLLTACGSKVSGKYGNDMVRYDFHSDGTVDQLAMGMQVRMKYKLEDKNVILETPQGSMIYVLQDDGSLQTPMGKLTKQQ